jgi:peptide deformylase
MTKPLELVKADDPILRKICNESFVVTLNQINMMFRLMRDKGGVGLAAPQVGINARLFVTAWGEVFVNPTIHSGEGCIKSKEGCLSLPGVVRDVPRLYKITLTDGRTYEGEKAIVIQHENDHLKGGLITDYGDTP